MGTCGTQAMSLQGWITTRSWCRATTVDVQKHLADYSDPSCRFIEGSDIRFSYQKTNLAAGWGNELKWRESESKKSS